MLMPKKVKYRKQMRGRRRGKAQRGSSVSFGDFGLKIMECGWITDKFGLSWQVVPNVLPKMLRDKDPERAQRVMATMLQMVKLDIKKLKQAAKQK